MAGVITFGRYALIEKLATGGMAEIFLAQATGEAGFEKTCVIKRVLPHLADAPGFTEMFLDEARLAAQLNHPGIVQIFDLGREGKDFYIAMEYLAGEDASAIQRQLITAGRRAPCDVAAKIISCAADALHFAHELPGADGKPLGVVHRDISLSNLFVTYQGAVKLLDFGIARAGQRLETTFPGHVKGKLAYMAPEQAEGRSVDRRADVWALGVCLHELLTGQRLFSRKTMEGSRKALMEDPITRPKALRPDVPEVLDNVVMAALERDPARRPPTALAIREELEAFLAAGSYVSQAHQLAEFMKQLFGADRTQARLNNAKATPIIQGGTEDLAAPAQEPTILDPRMRRVATGEQPAPKPRRWPLPLALVAIAGIAAAAWLRPQPAAVTASPPDPIPATAVEPPAPVVVETPPVEDLTPATTREEPPHPSHPRPSIGFLSVDSAEPARVFADGLLLGNTPVVRAKLSPGSHRVTLMSAVLGLAPPMRVVVKAGDVSVLHQAFERGKLNVHTEPWADVFVDGIPVGQTPLAGREVCAGEHQLRLKAAAGEKTISIQVPVGKTITVKETVP